MGGRVPCLGTSPPAPLLKGEGRRPSVMRQRLDDASADFGGVRNFAVCFANTLAKRGVVKEGIFAKKGREGSKTSFLNIVSDEIYDFIWILIKQKAKCEFLLTGIQFKAIISYFHIRYSCQTDFSFFNQEISSDVSSSNFC